MSKTSSLVVAGIIMSAAIALSGHTPAPQRGVSTPATVATSRGPEPPRLVVLLVIDQFRADYADLYGKQWTSGLKRLYDTGASFPLAAYPYGYTVTCAGHNTIGTGSVPATHGMIGNSWWDRSLNKLVTCTEDASATSVPFGGGTGTEHHSPKYVMNASFADELRAQAPRLPQIVSLSLKPRSAIGLAGHPGPGTMVIWEEDNGTWATSSAYAKAPWPEVNDYVTAHPIAAAYGTSWTKLLPPASYLFDDDMPGEPMPRLFPHALDSRTGQPDNAFVSLWERSPASDAYLGALATSLVTRLKLGQQPGTDMLAVSFSSLDLVGHAFGMHSHEVQDVLARLDKVIGELLTTLDKTVGPRNYVVALSADHGVAPMPEQAAALGLDAGRISTASTGELYTKLQSSLVKVLGAGTYIQSIASPNIYLMPGVLDRITSQQGSTKIVSDALLSVRGVAKVYWASELASSTSTDDRILRAMRLSNMVSRSGDLVYIPQPYWMAAATGATHGTPYDYDQRVPVLFMGAGIRPGRYLTPATPVDIAPTLAFLSRITLGRTDGHVLTDAVLR